MAHRVSTIGSGYKAPEPVPEPPKEVWKPIQDFPGYQLSNEGRVRRIKITYLKTTKNTVVLTQNKHTVHVSIAVLMRKLFP